MTDLERFFRQLVRNLAADPARLRQPIPVADIVRTVLPYRANRRALQLDTSEDYELVLMRLCAGEGGFAHAEPEEARAGFERELRSPNPDLEILRRHETALLTLAPGAVAAALADAPDIPEPVRALPETAGELLDELLEIDVAAPDATAAAVTPPAVAPPPLKARPAPPEPRAPPVSPVSAASPGPTGSVRIANAPTRSPAPPTPAESSTGVLCAFCGGALPTDRLVNFCPHCGQSQTQGRCPECGSNLERGWRHCVNCGTTVERADPARRRPP